MNRVQGEWEMSEALNTIYGMDLGTTYSCIAYVDEHGKPVIVPNQENQRVTPSVVFLDEDNIVVGEVAKENSKLYPDDVIAFIKRSMGDPHFEFEHNGQVYKPEEISSFILRKMVGDAEQILGTTISDVVITCPAYFGINEREATRLAGEIAGLNVRQVLNEPTSAAIAYGMAEEAEHKVMLVFDLGGGTFDVTMIDIRPEAIEVICTGGDHHLGGKDWDDSIVRFLASHFEEETGIHENEVYEDSETRQDLELSAERAKIILSQRARAPISITHGGERVKVELTREKFEELTDHLVEKTMTLTREMLGEAKKKGFESYDEILLVGGSTRMPRIRERIIEELGREPRFFDPDESVAKGAALYGWKLSLNDALVTRIARTTGQNVEEVKETPVEEISREVMDQAAREVADEAGFTLAAIQRSNIVIKNVCSKSFGIVAFDKDVEKVVNLILKNTTVPVEATQRFGTREVNQETVELRIMENEVSEDSINPEHAVEIGTAVLDMPANLPAGAPLDVTFTLNEEGRLEMTAVEKSEDRKVNATIETNSVIHGEELEMAKSRGTSLMVT